MGTRGRARGRARGQASNGLGPIPHLSVVATGPFFVVVVYWIPLIRKHCKQWRKHGSGQ